MSRPIRLLLGIVVVVLWHVPALSAVPAGSVIALNGQCFIEADGKRTQLKLADPVSIGDTLDVPAGGKLKLRMNDGSILSVAAGSRVTIAAYTVDADGKRHDVELSLAQGLLRAIVAPIDRPARFEVKTAVAAAAVRSTDWFLEARPDGATVAVLAGSVALTSGATGASVEIPARRGASIEAGKDPTPPRLWRQAEFNALIASTEPAQQRRAPRRRAATTGGDNSADAVPPGGYAPPPGDYAPPPPPPPGGYGPAPYYPGPYYPGPAPYHRYPPNAGGYPRGGYNPTPPNPSHGTHPQ